MEKERQLPQKYNSQSRHIKTKNCLWIQLITLLHEIMCSVCVCVLCSECVGGLVSTYRAR